MRKAPEALDHRAVPVRIVEHVLDFGRGRREAGEQARASGIERLFTIGAQSVQARAAFGSGRHFETMDELNAAVLSELPKSISVLVKGSRFMKMERVVQAIEAFAKKDSQGNTHAA